MRYIKNMENDAIYVWSELQAAKPNMIECDKDGNRVIPQEIEAKKTPVKKDTEPADLPIEPAKTENSKADEVAPVEEAPVEEAPVEEAPAPAPKKKATKKKAK